MQLFYFPASIPCRSILLFLHTINLQADLQVMNLMKGDHMAPEYLAVSRIPYEKCVFGPKVWHCMIRFCWKVNTVYCAKVPSIRRSLC